MSNETNAAEPSGASAGSQPVGWGAVASDGSVVCMMRRRADVASYVVDGTPIVPLYRLPALTQDERWAIAAAVADARGQAYRAKRFVSSEVAATFEKQARLLLGLAERLN